MIEKKLQMKINEEARALCKNVIVHTKKAIYMEEQACKLSLLLSGVKVCLYIFFSGNRFSGSAKGQTNTLTDRHRDKQKSRQAERKSLRETVR